ncbi:MAG TPA: metalloregulator ArsR/SmtB family transcription factor [Rhodanobacteraceae bacterium]|nr:metalloregulator ArsR/SmtB family transcription factor [Rhodanobacteraceae bacterium]
MHDPINRYQLAEFGSLIAEPARAAMLLALLDNRARPAGELATLAGVGAAAASAHLKRLSDAGLLAVEAQGRHRYYRLAGEHVAHWLETFALASPRIAARKLPPVADAAFLRARTCYQHLAGRLGVALFDRLRGVSGLDLGSNAVRLNDRGARLLAKCGLLDGTLGRAQREGRTCVDWTERRFHLSGPLGTLLARRLIDNGWLRRTSGTRSLVISAAGRRGLAALDIEC